MEQNSTSDATHRSAFVNLRVSWQAVLLIGALLVADVALRTGHAAQNPAPPKSITAQEFRLVDKDGSERAALALQPDGSPYLSMTDKAAKRRITLRIRPDGGATFAINDPDGKNRIAIDSGADGSSSVTISGKTGKGGAGLITPPNGDPVIMVRDKDGAIAFLEPHPEDAQDLVPPKPGEKPKP